MNTRQSILKTLGVITLLGTMVVCDARAELILELGAGYSYPTDGLGDDHVGSQPLGTVMLGYEHKSGYGISYTHISNPTTTADYGINMLRVTKRFSWF